MLTCRSVGTGRHFVGSVAVAVLVGGAVTVAGLGFGASAAGAVIVGDETALRVALADLTETSIVLSADVTVTCDPGELLRPAAAADLIIDGAGFTITQTCAGSRVLHTESPVELSDVTITGGDDTTVGVGGGVFANASITLTGVTITGNQTRRLPDIGGNGGGMFSNGTTVIRSSTISGNTAAGGTGIFGGLGGGIAGNGSYTVTDSTISGNTAGGAATGGGTGGAVFGNGSFTFIRSTISGNSAAAGSTSDGGLGGAMATNNDITLISSTVEGNVAQGAGSAIGGVAAGGELLVVNSTVARNSSAVGGANLDGGSSAGQPAHLVNSVIALPLGGSSNCGNDNPAANTSGGHNYSDDDSCALDAPTDIEEVGGDPALGGLAANGGPTPTLLPAAGSPLLDAIPPAACEGGQAAATPTDQRGIARPQGTGCDIGAVEVEVAGPGSEPQGPAPTGAGPLRAAPTFTG